MNIAHCISPAPLWYQDLRESEIFSTVQQHPFIISLANGDPLTVRKFVGEFTPYMFMLGTEIGRRGPGSSPAVARAMADKLEFVIARQEEMRLIDGPHSLLWEQLATSYGVRLDLNKQPVPALNRLLRTIISAADAPFYASIATCQAVATAVSKLAQKGAIRHHADISWFLVHLTHRFPTHEDIYRWVAEQLYKVTNVQDRQGSFENIMRGTLELFVEFANELGRTMHPALVAELV
jgi:hypothetical protein